MPLNALSETCDNLGPQRLRDSNDAGCPRVGDATTRPSPTLGQPTPKSLPTFTTPTQTATFAAPTQTAPTPVPTSAPTTQAPPTPSTSRLTLQRVAENLSFSRLTNLAQAGGRLFVSEQTGRVMSFPLSPDLTEATVFLDIRSQVSTAGNEEGLLGLAFDPDFEANGHFYVYYSAANPRRSVIARFTIGGLGTVSFEEATAIPESDLVVLEVPQPFSNHNGGQLGFGPDGMLYISLGDGGSGGDPQGNGQNASTLLGSILRIDVSGMGPDQGYRVPPDNPFAGSTDARGEIWAYGLRESLAVLFRPGERRALDGRRGPEQFRRGGLAAAGRSAERRVGKEGRSRCSPYP